jgi:hypothetical protein
MMPAKPTARVILATALAVGLSSDALALDVDGDGIDDLVDVCPNTPPGIPVDAEGRPLGDLDVDCDADLDDFGVFQGSFTGPLYPAEDVCTDGLDNDHDGLTDCEDPHCEGRACGDFGLICVAAACQCPGPAEICDDVVDNDCDGLADCEDVDCDGQPCGTNGMICIAQACQCPGSVEVCNDAADNDCDGLADCEDVVDCPPGTSCGTARYVCGPAGDCSCAPPYDDCDGNYGNGCETDLGNDPYHCGSCDSPCQLPQANDFCLGGTCQIASCWTGWCDWDHQPQNGCEFDLDTDPTCPGTNLGSVVGDDGADVITHYDRGEKWYWVTVTDDGSSPALPGLVGELGVRITLASPPGDDYDLYVYCPECNHQVGSSAAGAGATDTVLVWWDDFWGQDNQRYVDVQVRHYSVNTCDDYILKIYGNSPGGNECPD